MFFHRPDRRTDGSMGRWMGGSWPWVYAHMAEVMWCIIERWGPFPLSVPCCSSPAVYLSENMPLWVCVRESSGKKVFHSWLDGCGVV